MLKKELKLEGFSESVTDSCVFINKDIIILVYVNNCIIVSNSDILIAHFLQSLKDGSRILYLLMKAILSNILVLRLRSTMTKRNSA